MIDDKTRARMLKLLAMAKQTASPAEADNARRMLDALLAKHGMAEAELTSDEKPERRKYTYRTALEKRLILQVCAMVCDSRDGTRYGQGVGKKWISLELLPSQHADVEVCMSVYADALAAHIDAAYIAFVHANNIFPKTAPSADEDRPEPTQAELDRAAAVRKLAAATRATPVHKQIGAAA